MCGVRTDASLPQVEGQGGVIPLSLCHQEVVDLG